MGDNQAYLHIVDVAGKAVPGARVTVTPGMQGMAMESRPVEATEQGNGVYVAPVTLSMAGQWQIKVAVHSAEGMGEAAFKVTAGQSAGTTKGGSLPWPVIGGVALGVVILGILLLRRKPSA